jgi:hypothetical protein
MQSWTAQWNWTLSCKIILCKEWTLKAYQCHIFNPISAVKQNVEGFSSWKATQISRGRTALRSVPKWNKNAYSKRAQDVDRPGHARRNDSSSPSSALMARRTITQSSNRTKFIQRLRINSFLQKLISTLPYANCYVQRQCSKIYCYVKCNFSDPSIIQCTRRWFLVVKIHVTFSELSS